MSLAPDTLAAQIIAALEDGKAIDIQQLDVRDLTTITDFMIVASGGTSRQVKALSERVQERARAEKLRPLGVEGQQNAEWLLLDYGDVIVHIMQPKARDFYQLEKLWGPLALTAAAL